MNNKTTFIDTLRFLKSQGLTNIRAIIWTMNSSIRSLAELESQANFINQFDPKWIWDRVIIIVKEAANPEQQCQGAVR